MVPGQIHPYAVRFGSFFSKNSRFWLNILSAMMIKLSVWRVLDIGLYPIYNIIKGLLTRGVKFNCLSRVRSGTLGTTGLFFYPIINQLYLHCLKTPWLSCCGMYLCIHILPRFSQFCLATIRPCATRLDIKLERMLIHRNILLQTSRDNISDARLLVCEMTKVVIQAYGAIYQMQRLFVRGTGTVVI